MHDEQWSCRQQGMTGALIRCFRDSGSVTEDVITWPHLFSRFFSYSWRKQHEPLKTVVRGALFKKNGGKKGRMQRRDMRKMHWRQGFRRFFLLFHFSFFCCGSTIYWDGSRVGRICIKEGKMKRTLRITSQGPVSENLMCFSSWLQQKLKSAFSKNLFCKNIVSPPKYHHHQ